MSKAFRLINAESCRRQALRADLKAAGRVPSVTGAVRLLLAALERERALSFETLRRVGEVKHALVKRAKRDGPRAC
jgi:hypothetical protein